MTRAGRRCLTLLGVAFLSALLYARAPAIRPCFAPTPAEAATPFEQHFAPDDNLERIDVAALDGARASIDMAAYVLSDLPVIAALTRAAGRGVAVRVFRQLDDFDPSRASAAGLDALERAGATIRYKDPTRPLMHLKAYCVDGALLRVGAANFSASGLKRQNNDLELARGPGVCAAFEKAFSEMWEGK